MHRALHPEGSRLVASVSASALVLLALVVGLAGPPSAAACPGSRPFTSGEGRVFTAGICPIEPCPPGAPSVTADLRGSFWELGAGSPNPGEGNDSGEWPAREGAYPEETGWLVTSPDGAPRIASDWAFDPRVDGCIADGCMAMLLSDQLQGEGYFAAVTAPAGPDGEFTLTTGDLALARIERPVIRSATRLPPDGFRFMFAPYGSPVAGLRHDPSCAPAMPRGYRLYQRSLPPGRPEPFDRDRQGWTVAAGGEGPDATPLPFGSSAVVTVPRYCAGWRVLFAVSLVFDGAFETPLLSASTGAALSMDVDHDCDGWPGFSENPDLPPDCDDSEPAVYPLAPQVCDHRNNDCFHPAWPGLAGTNEDGPDDDGDSWTGSCDNCPRDFNPSQSDRDGDGDGDLCDLDDGTILFRDWASDRVGWQNELGFDSWNLYRGSLGVLAATGTYTQPPGSVPAAGRECGLPLPEHADPFVPVAGEPAFYLVTGVGGGTEGDLGTDGAGRARLNTLRCP